MSLRSYSMLAKDQGRRFDWSNRESFVNREVSSMKYTIIASCVSISRSFGSHLAIKTQKQPSRRP